MGDQGLLPGQQFGAGRSTVADGDARRGRVAVLGEERPQLITKIRIGLVEREIHGAVPQK
jgi:hypothetical protein